MATFVRIVFPVFVVAVGVLAWMLLEPGGPRADRLEPAGGPAVREGGSESAAAPDAAGPRDDARVGGGAGAGTGSLVVTVVDRTDGSVMRSWVQLRRLPDADGGAVARALAAYGRVRFDGLAAGEYRVLAERCRAAEPVTKTVSVGAGADAVAEARLAIPVPREFPVFLRMVGPDGGEVEPAGALARLLAIEGERARRPTAHELAGRPVGDDGRIGTFEEDELGGPRTWVFEVVPARGAVPVRVAVDGAEPGARTFAAPRVPWAPIRAAVRAAEPAAEVEVRARLEAVPAGNDADLARARGVAVRVSATAEGHEPAEFAFPADGAPPPTELPRARQG